MYQAYAGKVLNGKPAILEEVTLPEDTKLVIMVLDELPSKKTKSQRQLEAFNKFIASNNAITDEPLTNDFFDVLENNRANLSREVDFS